MLHRRRQGEVLDIRVPFEALWSMKITVPYSLFLRSGGLGWSCGQCPLDRDGDVVAPGDSAVQAALVARYAATVLDRAGMTVGDLCMAVIYHDEADPAQMLAILRGAFGPGPLLVPVRCPAFYYDGMRIEVDLFAAAGGPVVEDRQTVRGGGMRFCHALGHPPATWTEEVALVEHWAAPVPHPLLPAHAVIDPALPETVIWAVSVPGDGMARGLAIGPAQVNLRRAGGFLALTALAPGVAGLVPQTEAVMAALDQVLTSEGLAYTDVLKSTTHYCGQPTERDLHDNMAVRNRRYTAPGPVSTGVRVAGLAAAGALTAVSLLLRVR